MKTWEEKTVYLMSNDDFLFNSCEFALITKVVHSEKDMDEIVYSIFAETKDGHKYEDECYNLEEAKIKVEEFFEAYENSELDDKEVVYD